MPTPRYEIPYGELNDALLRLDTLVPGAWAPRLDGIVGATRTFAWHGGFAADGTLIPDGDIVVPDGGTFWIQRDASGVVTADADLDFPNKVAFARCTTAGWALTNFEDSRDIQSGQFADGALPYAREAILDAPAAMAVASSDLLLRVDTGGDAEAVSVSQLRDWLQLNLTAVVVSTSLLIGTATRATNTPGLDVLTSNGLVGFTDTVTDLATKSFRLGVRHHTNSEEMAAVLYADSGSGTNRVNIGGGTAQLNAATIVNIYTAANATTTTGTLRASWNAAGLFAQVGDATIGGTLGVTGLLTGGLASFSSSGATTLLITNTSTGSNDIAIATRTTDDPSFGGSWIGRRSRTTGGAVQNNDVLAGIYGQGHDGTSFYGVNVAAIRLLAAETHTTGPARGTKIDFATTAIGGSTRVVRGTITDAGVLAWVGNTTIGGTLMIGNTTAPTGSYGVASTATLAFVGSDAVTDAVDKNARFAGRHYTNAEEVIAGMMVSAQAAANIVNIGGGSGAMNAATRVNIWTAANTTTLTGTTAAFWDSTGALTQSFAATFNGLVSATLGLTVTGAAFTASGDFVHAIARSANGARNVLALNNLDQTAGGAQQGGLVWNFVATGDATQVQAAQILVAKVQEWTTTASTQDALMNLRVAIDGTLTTVLTLSSTSGLATGSFNGRLYVYPADTTIQNIRNTLGTVNSREWSHRIDTATGAYSFRSTTDVNTTVATVFTATHADGSVTFGSSVAVPSDLVLTGSTGIIRSNTSDASDTKAIAITGGGSTSNTRGALAVFYGNENATANGRLLLTTGNASAADFLAQIKGVDFLAVTRPVATNLIVLTGDVTITGSISPGSYVGLGTMALVNDAPSDGLTYARKNGAWVAVTTEFVSEDDVLATAEMLW